MAEKVAGIAEGDAALALASDPVLWCRTWLGDVFRDEEPVWSREAWDLLEGPGESLFRFLMMFRGAGKTTRIRAAALRRIVHRFGKYVVIVGRTVKPHAHNSVEFIRSVIERDVEFREFYGVRPSSRKWKDGELVLELRDEKGDWTERCHVQSFGIEGSFRGLNVVGHRPDLILLDDVIDEENSATPEVRDKVNDKILTAIKDSLAPRSEAPWARILGAATPQHKEDFLHLAMKTPLAQVMRVGCWTRETEMLALEERESSWPARFPSEELRRECAAAIAMGKGHLFAREKECRIVAPEGAVLKESWLRYWDEDEVDVRGGVTCIAVDPTPPPTERELAKGMTKKDYTAISVVRCIGRDFYLLEYFQERGLLPREVSMRVLDMAFRNGALKVVVETQGGGSYLAEELRRTMHETGRHLVLQEFSKKESKFEHIVGTLAGLAQGGNFWCRRGHSEFIMQFSEYPNVAHDDLLDSVAMAVRGLREYGMAAVEHFDAEEELWGDTPVITIAP